MAKKVLVVDDSVTVCEQVETLLSAAGYVVIKAIDGIEGAEKVESTEGIAVVISDVNMPRMGGLEMVQRIKSSAKHAALPIVMLTTDAQPALIAQAKAAGVKGWLVKPFNPAMLVSVVKRFAGD